MALGFHHNIEQQQAPSLFARGPSPFARLVFFATLSLSLIVTDAKLHYLTGIRQYLITMLHPLQVIANSPSALYSSAAEYFSTHHRLLSENKQLKKQTLAQGVSIQKLNSLSLENNHLRELLQAKQNLKEQSIAAEVMYVGRDIFTKKIIVNRGQKHHVLAGEAVVDGNGVIGQVTQTFPYTSEVTLITDKSLAIPVQIERNGLRAIAFGRGRDNTLDLPFLPTNVDVQKGDKLVTSGIDGVYPAGLAVAMVTSVDLSNNSAFARITCIPTGGTENHRQVLLVRLPEGSNLSNEALSSESNNVSEQNNTSIIQPPQPVSSSVIPKSQLPSLDLTHATD